MTRREWLRKNPPPKVAGPLLDRAEELEKTGSADDAKAAARFREEAKTATSCPKHTTVPLHRHKNRPEDLFLCSNGPHFLLWTQFNGKAAFLPVSLAELPDLDAQM
jgi:hypothetical protein